MANIISPNVTAFNQKQVTKMTSQQQGIEWYKCKMNPFYFIFNHVYIPEIGGIMKYDKAKMHSKMKQTVRACVVQHRCLLRATRQLGKALSLETPIPQPNGNWTTMGDLKIGDIILGKNGKPTKVTKVTDIMYNHNCYEIEFDYHGSIIADEEHLWDVGWRPMNKFYGTVTTKRLKEMVESRTSKSGRPYIEVCDPIDNLEKKLLIHPYYLGLWLGDGCSDGARINCSFEDSMEYMDIFDQIGIESDIPRMSSKTGESGYFRQYGIWTHLKTLGLLNNKHIPREYLSASINQRLELLQGLMDSDGEVSKDGSCQFHNKDFKLIQQVRELLSSLGIKSRWASRNSVKGYENEVYYRIKFCTLMFNVCKLPRKQIRQDNVDGHPKNRRHYIKSVTRVKSVPVKCIEVDSADHLFLCGEMIPTHNSTIAACMLEWANNFYPSARSVILNATKDYALENLDKVKFIHEHIPNELQVPLKYKGDRKTYMEYVHGSKLRVFYPSSSTKPDTLARSLTSAILYIDEAAFIRYMAIAYGSAMPTMTRAREQAIKNGYPYFILVTSTPNGTVGDGEWFYDMHQHAIDAELVFDENDLFIPEADEIINNKERNGFIDIRFHWSDDLTKDKEWYDEQCRDLNFNTRQINQELDLLFVGSTACIFDDDYLGQLKSVKPTTMIKLPHATRLNLYTDQFDIQDFLIVGVDTAKSMVGDYNAIEVFSYANFIQVGEFFGKLGSLTKYSEVLMALVRYLAPIMQGRIILGIENNSIGGAIIENLENATDYDYMQYVYNPIEMRRANKDGQIVLKQKIDPQYGINTNVRTKSIMVSALYDYLTENIETAKSSDFIAQLNLIERKANGTVSAQHGKHDDLFMAAALCAYVRRLSALEVEPMLGTSTYERQQQSSEGYYNVMIDKATPSGGMQMVYNENEGGFEYVDDTYEYEDSELPVSLF